MNKRIIIEGDVVHHVGYRPFLLAKAVKLGIQNYEAENIEETGKQKVIISIAGDEKQIREFLEFAKKNYPKKAKVSKVSEDESPPERVMSIENYQKVLSAEQQNTIVQTGLMMLNKQEMMLSKQDETIKVLGEKIDTVGSKVDTVGNKVDVVGSKVDVVGSKVDVVGSKVDAVGNKVDSVGTKVDTLKDTTHQDFNRMDVKYDKVSKKMDGIDHTIEHTMKELTQAIIKLAEVSARK